MPIVYCPHCARHIADSLAIALHLERAYPAAPYPPPGAPGAPPPVQQVPAPFASIMNAYNTAPRSPESPYEPTPLNGGVSRLRGAANGGER